MFEERKFTETESELMLDLVHALMDHAPCIKPKSLFVTLDDMEFYWKDLEENKRIEHLVWLSKRVYVRTPKIDARIKEHIIQMVPHLVRQLYEQMDYKEHMFTHTLNCILYKDHLGRYRDQYRQSISFYKTILNAYRTLPEYHRLGETDKERQYLFKKEQTENYGKGFELALQIYTNYKI